LAARTKVLQPKASNRQIANTLGVAPATVDRDIASNEAPKPKESKETASSSSTAASNEAPPAKLSGADAAQAVEKVDSREARATDSKKKREASRGAWCEPGWRRFRTIEHEREG
jgi:IS30 family transposase